MCGVAAIVAPEAARLRPRLEAMLDAQAHRGPDGRGVTALRGCLLGHVRLSILDAEGGAQPMRAAPGGAAVAFNGELYDYRERRRSYAQPFRTDSDTELLLAAHARHGRDMCRHLGGMFAFALWDEARQRLVCGRDRFGEKPLYYARGDGGELLVASELPALLASGLVLPHVDRTALAAYLRMGFVPEGLTMFREVRQLPPGHTLLCEDGRLTLERFWTPPPPVARPPRPAEAVRLFRVLMEQAVERSLVADVEVGILLSGGLDSTTVAALATRRGKFRAFAFGLEGPESELAYARAAARRLGLPLTECAARDVDLPALLQCLPQIYGEPLADTSSLTTLLLCREVAQQVKTALAGDGGDELLGGYAWYAGLDRAAATGGAVSNGWTRYAAAHFQRRCFASSAQLVEAGLEPWYPTLPPSLTDTLDDALRMDVAAFLPSDVLKKTDRAAMSCGLELRSPFLDADLADYLLSLPPEFKRAHGRDKLLLRAAFGALWPPCVRTRPKQGFGMNSAALLARGDVRELARASLTGAGRAIHELLPRPFVEARAGARDRLGWALLILALWCEDARKRGWLNG